MCCRMFRSVPGLYPLDDSSPPPTPHPVVTTKTVFRLCQMFPGGVGGISPKLLTQLSAVMLPGASGSLKACRREDSPWWGLVGSSSLYFRFVLVKEASLVSSFSTFLSILEASVEDPIVRFVGNTEVGGVAPTRGSGIRTQTAP